MSDGYPSNHDIEPRNPVATQHTLCSIADPLISNAKMLEQLDVGSLFIGDNLFNLDVVPKVCRKVSAICWVL